MRPCLRLRPAARRPADADHPARQADRDDDASPDFASADYQRTGGATITEDGDPELWSSMVLTNVLGPALLAKAGCRISS